MSEAVAYFLPKRTMGEFSQYVVIEETMRDAAQITEHPVEIGAEITDHIFLKPAAVTIRGLSGVRFGPLTATFERLRALWRARIPFDVVTGKAAYRNMVIETIDAQTDGSTENILAFTVNLREIILVSVQVVSVPASEKHANPAKTQATQQGGTKSTGGEYRRSNLDVRQEGILDGPPEPVDSVLQQATGVTGADSLGDFFQ